MTTCLTENSTNRQLDIAIDLKGISKKYSFTRPKPKSPEGAFGELYALNDVTLSVCKGTVLGIIGRNGAGKTTILNIVAGVLSPTQGECAVNGRVLSLFNLGVGFQEQLSGRENIFLNAALLGAERQEVSEKLNAIIEFSELGDFINAPLGTYSTGMRLRLAFSVIANLDFDILVIDEVLAVGDALFQDKCLKRLMDFKRSGKTLIITTQNMHLIERLCDETILLDHGRILFYGSSAEAIDKYHALLNTEKFFVGPSQKNVNLIENTKKWADSMSWGQKLGTKEVTIDSVTFLSAFGIRCNRVKTGSSLTIRADFTARNDVEEPHFGIAIFREDGVYCYGPNTSFDGHHISDIKRGGGYFALKFNRFFLAPGRYHVSVAIWDKNETLAFDYHNGCYKFEVTGGDNRDKQVLKMPFRLSHSCSVSNGKPRGTEDLKIRSIRLLDSSGEEKTSFITNEPARLAIETAGRYRCRKGAYLQADIYRNDDVFCQRLISVLAKDKDIFNFLFSGLPLLPGGYKIYANIWDAKGHRYLYRRQEAYAFKMVFRKEDHGTVYLEHAWQWSKSR